MFYSKLRSLLFLYIDFVRRYYFFKTYAPYLSHKRLKALKALGKEGYANQEPCTISFLQENDIPRSFLTKLVLYPLKHTLTLRGTQEKLSGDLILKTVNGDVKIFSFSEKLVLNFLADKHKYHELKVIYDYYGRFFQTPIINSNDELHCFTENLIDHVPFDQLTDAQHQQILQALLDATKEHVAELDKENLKMLETKELIADFKQCFNSYNNSIINRLLTIASTGHIEDKIPLIPCHGDPQKNNVLLRNDEVYFIDWEYAQDYVFYYDPIYMLIEPHIYRPTSNVAVEPFTEHNIQALQELFLLFDLNLTWKNMSYYLALALMQRLIQAKENGNSNINYDLECFEQFWKYFEKNYN